MNVTRRTAFSAFAVGAASMQKVAEVVAGRVAGQGNAMLNAAQLGVGYSDRAESPANPHPRPRRYATLQEALVRVPGLREQIRERLIDEHRVVHHIDPDLAILRSISPMAKIAYQRQRNVEQALERILQGERIKTSLYGFINNVLWGDEQ